MHCGESRAITQCRCLSGEILTTKSFVLFLLAASALLAQTLSPIKRKIVEAVNGDQETSPQSLGKLVNILNRVFDQVLRGAGGLSFVASYVASISGRYLCKAAHADGEFVELASQTYQTRRVALFLFGLTR